MDFSYEIQEIKNNKELKKFIKENHDRLRKI